MEKTRFDFFGIQWIEDRTWRRQCLTGWPGHRIWPTWVSLSSPVQWATGEFDKLVHAMCGLEIKNLYSSKYSIKRTEDRSHTGWNIFQQCSWLGSVIQKEFLKLDNNLNAFKMGKISIYLTGKKKYTEIVGKCMKRRYYMPFGNF